VRWYYGGYFFLCCNALHTRSGVMGSNPSTFATGYSYARLGYTTAFDAAVAPLGARHAHEEFHDTPVIDKGFFVLMGNNEFILRCLKAGEAEKLRHFAAWLLGAAKGYAIKLVNPGGVEVWKGTGRNVARIDDVVEDFGVTPRQIIVGLAQVAMDLGLPHPVHIHANNLGLAGNWETTLETMKALEGRRAHLTHVQFHSYGGEPGGRLSSRVADLVEYVVALLTALGWTSRPRSRSVLAVSADRSTFSASTLARVRCSSSR